VIVPVTTVVTTGPATPPFLGSIVNAASQIPASVAPGEILTVYGFGVGPSDTAGFTLNASGGVATSLNGAQVLFDGTPAPMIYGSAYQANVIVPYEVANKATTAIALAYGGVTSSAWSVPVAASAPGVFTIGATGLGQAAVLNQDSSVNSASNPAPRGSVIQIYATGEGQTSPPGVTGSVIETNLKRPLLPVTVSIGGQNAVVQYSGSAADSVAGLLQVNAVVPQGVTPGVAVPIVVSVGGVPSQNGVTITVQ
jgi:trimeric autotransporter adhesin